MTQLITVKLRLKDKHSALLDRQARAVNYVWNYCNETQQRAVRDGRRWLSAFDLCNLTAGSSKDLGLHSHTIQGVCRQYYSSRKQHRKPWLRWRSKKSLGWVPFNTGYVSFDGQRFKFSRASYETMHLREILKPGMHFGAGSFNSDNKGRWYINLLIEVETANVAPIKYAGIDLGLKTLAMVSSGVEIETPSFYRKAEQTLATAQRRRKTKRITAIHAKVANRRKDFLHKASAAIAKEFGCIFIGDVSSSKLARTKMAKSVLDAGWADFKRMLSYKAIRHGGSALEVSEHLTTQTCSGCGSLPASRPKGIAGLSKRMWTCDDCGAVHDRDVNAAQNILRIGLDTLSGGIHV